MPGASKREDTENNDETNTNEKVRKPENVLKDKEHTSSTEEITQKPTTPPTPIVPIELAKMSKIYVGNYATIEQAIQAQNKLMNATNSVSPFVKEINGTYVLQVGSYANPTKAEAVAKEINALGFQTKIVKE